MAEAKLSAHLAAREQEILGHPERIPPLPRDELLDEAMAMWTDLRSNFAGHRVEPGHPDDLPAIFFTVLRRRELWAALTEMTFQVTGKSHLSVRDRELVVLRTAWLLEAPYEWGEHVGKAKDGGVTDAEIEQVITGSSHPAWSRGDAALMAMAEELQSRAMISDETWSELAVMYNEEQLMELPLLVGQYQMVAFFQNALRLPLRGVNQGLRTR